MLFRSTIPMSLCPGLPFPCLSVRAYHSHVSLSGLTIPKSLCPGLPFPCLSVRAYQFPCLSVRAYQFPCLSVRAYHSHVSLSGLTNGPGHVFTTSSLVITQNSSKCNLDFPSRFSLEFIGSLNNGLQKEEADGRKPLLEKYINGIVSQGSPYATPIVEYLLMLLRL